MTPIPKPAEIFPYGIRRAWLDDNRIALIIIPGTDTAEAVDAWAEVLADTVQNWPAGQPVLLLHDLSHPTHTGTLQTFKRMGDVYEMQMVGRVAYSAVIVGGGLVNMVMCKLLRRHRQDGLHERAFTDRDEALAWLQHMLETQQDTSGQQLAL